MLAIMTATAILPAAFDWGEVDAFPLGRIDVASNRAYIASAKGVEAIDLATGLTVWTSKVADNVLFLWDDKIAVRSAPVGNSFRILLLSGNTGAMILQSAPVTIPIGVLPEALNFAVKRDGVSLAVMWQGESAYRGGAPPPPGVPMATRKLTGAFTFDTATGAVRTQPAQSLQNHSEASIEYGAGLGNSRLPWRCGASQYVLRRPIKATATLVLKQWPEGRTVEVTKLPDPVAQVAADGCFVFIHSATQPRDWVVFPVVGGPSRTIRYEAGAFSPVFAGSRVFYLVDTAPPSASEAALQLKAVSISGQRLWQRTVPIATNARGKALRQ